MENNNKTYVTQEGYEQYLQALKECEEKYAEHLKTRQEYGINSNENYQTGFYDEESAFLRNTIAYLKESIKNLVIIESQNQSDAIVSIGDTVNILMNNTNELRRVKLIGGIPDYNSNNEVLSVSINSPLGRAIYKNTVGTQVSYSVGNNKFTGTIISKETQQSSKEFENQPE